MAIVVIMYMHLFTIFKSVLLFCIDIYVCILLIDFQVDAASGSW